LSPDPHETVREPFSEWVWVLLPNEVSVLRFWPEEMTPLDAKACVSLWVRVNVSTPLPAEEIVVV
jgi:hypothetical protein